jgi:hypothetical protein
MLLAGVAAPGAVAEEAPPAKADRAWPSIAVRTAGVPISLGPDRPIGTRPQLPLLGSPDGRAASRRSLGEPDDTVSRATLGIDVDRRFVGIANQPLVTPADPTGAIGATAVVTAVNVRVAVYSRTGALLVRPIRLRDLDPGAPKGLFETDPRVVYDAKADVFVLAYLLYDQKRNVIEVVTIPGATARRPGTWCTTRIAGDQNPRDVRTFADYPMVGFSDTRVTVSTNNFRFTQWPPGRFVTSQLLSLNKADLYDCGSRRIRMRTFTGLRDPDGSRAFSVQPAITVGGAKEQWLVSLDRNRSKAALVVWRIRPSGGELRLSRAARPIGRLGSPPFGTQCRGRAGDPNTWWDTGDIRLTTAWFDGTLGRLFTANSARGNPGGGAVESVIRWWEIDPGFSLPSSSILRRGTIGVAGRDAGWPSVATDGVGNLWLNYARAGLGGAGECLSMVAGVVAPGETAATTAVVVAGRARYEVLDRNDGTNGVERWGDYSALSRDPLAPAVVAVVGAVPTGTGTSRTWLQRIGLLRAI